MKMNGIGKETTENIQNEIPSMIQPWQYKDSKIQIVNIDSVLSDIIYNWKEDIRFRQGFKINEDKSLNIPTMFVQINGIYQDKNKYREFLNSLETKETIRIKDTKNMFSLNNSLKNKLNDLLLENYNVSKNKKNYKERTNFLINTKIEIFGKLNASTEKLLYEKFRDFVTLYPNLKSDVYAKIMNLDNKILNLLQNFDFCFKNPKIIVENMDDNNFNKTDKYVLIFLYSLGFDIIIFSPKGLSFLKDYDINTITLDNYLNADDPIYDYRCDAEILKEEKKEIAKIKKQEKQEKKLKNKKNRKKKYKILLFLFILFNIIMGFGWITYYNLTLSETAKMKKIEKNMYFEYPTKTMYINKNDVIIYLYPNEKSPTTESFILKKDDEIEVIKENNVWIQFKIDSSTYYILKDCVRDNYYSEEISNFVINLNAPSKISVYKFMDIKSEVLFTYEIEENIKVIGYTDNFYQVEKNNKVGFIEKEIFEQSSQLELKENNEISFLELILVLSVIFGIIFLFFLFVSYILQR